MNLLGRIFFHFLVFFPILIFSQLESPLFNYFQSEIDSFEDPGKLPSLISERLLEIETLKEKWSSLQKELPEHFLSVFKSGTVELEEEGAGGTYIVYNTSKQPKFVIKPIDENILCLHNPKGFASPFNDKEHRIKAGIPLYRSSLTEALCYEVAKICQLEHITPMTFLSILFHPHFFYLSKGLCPNKLCSVQTYIENSYSLHKILGELFALNIGEKELQEQFDQEDFEDINLFIWLTYDNDAHPENFRAYPKKINEKGMTVYGIKKIDNSLCFPEKNTHFFNSLMYFPNALEPLSAKIRQKILELPVEEINRCIHKYGLYSTSLAFYERISILKQLAQETEMTYYECSLRLDLLGKGLGS